MHQEEGAGTSGDASGCQTRILQGGFPFGSLDSHPRHPPASGHHWVGDQGARCHPAAGTAGQSWGEVKRSNTTDAEKLLLFVLS